MLDAVDELFVEYRSFSLNSFNVNKSYFVGSELLFYLETVRFLILLIYPLTWTTLRCTCLLVLEYGAFLTWDELMKLLPGRLSPRRFLLFERTLIA